MHRIHQPGNFMVLFWVCAAIVAASIEPIVAKCGYGCSVTPWQLLIIKCIVGALVILPLTRTLRWVGWDAFRQIILLAMLLLVTGTLTLLSLKHLSAACFITIMTTTPAFVAILNQQLGRDSLTVKFWIGFLCAFVGVLLGLNFYEVSISQVGLIEVLGAVASSTVYRVRTEAVTAQLSPALVSTYIFLINGIIALCFLPFVVGELSQTAWLYGSWMGLAAAAANVAFLFALSILGSTRVSVINMMQRPLIALSAALVLHESLQNSQIVGLLLVMIGVQTATVRRQSETGDTVLVAEELQLSKTVMTSAEITPV